MSDEIRSEPLYVIVRYRLKPEYIERSGLQAAELYSELAADGPAWLRPFQRHRGGLAERCAEPPTTTRVRLLGAYRLF